VANQPTTGSGSIITSRAEGSSKADLVVAVLVEEVETTTEDSATTTTMAGTPTITSKATASDWTRNLGIPQKDDGHCEENQL